MSNQELLKILGLSVKSLETLHQIYMDRLRELGAPANELDHLNDEGSRIIRQIAATVREIKD